MFIARPSAHTCQSRMAMKRKPSKTGLASVASALILCPVCSKQVPLAVINVHLDTSCQKEGSHKSQHQSERTQSECPQAQESKQGSPKRQKISDHEQDKLQREAETQEEQGHLPPRLTHVESAGAGRICVNLAADDSTPSDHGNNSGTAAEETSQEAKAQAAPPPEIGSISGEKGDKAEARTEKVSADVFERMKSAAKNKLPGQFLFENFISEEEEKQLIEYIDTCDPPWHLSTFNGPHGGKAWGVRMDLQKRTVIAPKHPMPGILLKLAERMRKWGPLKDFYPSEANANDYLPSQGMYLGPHVDDRQLSTGAIVTLSLVDAAVMTFQREKLGKNAAKIRIKLPARSLQALTGDSRYSFTHAIAKEDFHGSRRLSVTFRQSPLKPQ